MSKVAYTPLRQREPTTFSACFVAEALLDLYLAESARVLKWEIVDECGIYAGLLRVGELVLVAYRGSDRVEDWVRDFEAWPRSTTHPQLGRVPAGFFEGIEQHLGVLSGEVSGQRFVLAGHSLGAARASLAAGLYLSEGRPGLEQVICFGSPRAGMSRLRALLSRLSMVSYRNRVGARVDSVTTKPFHIPLIAPYVQACPMTSVSESGDTGPFGLHHMRLYAAGIVV